MNHGCAEPGVIFDLRFRSLARFDRTSLGARTPYESPDEGAVLYVVWVIVSVIVGRHWGITRAMRSALSSFREGAAI